jgi:amino acid adenylation domain-containing protein
MTSSAFTSGSAPDGQDIERESSDGDDALFLDARTVLELKIRCKEFGACADYLVLSTWLLLLHQLADKDELAVRIHDTRTVAHVSRLDPLMPWLVFSSATRDRLLESARAMSGDATDALSMDKVSFQGCTAGYCVGMLPSDMRCGTDPHLWVYRCDRGDDAWSLHVSTTLPGALARQHLVLWRSMIHALIESPEVPVATLSAIQPQERERIIGRFNDTARTYPADQTIVSLFTALARENPAKTALRDEKGSMSREALMQQACKLAHHLSAMGVGKGEGVALLMERDASMVVATLAVLFAGGVYCPIDPSYPEARVRHYLEDTGTRVLLVSGHAAQALSSKLVSDGGFAGRILSADRDSLEGLEPAVPADFAALSSAMPDDPAYIMYTSGTTGRPKGVLVTHRGVVRLVRGTDYVELDEDTRMLQAGAIGFDAATFEIWGALLNGGELHVVDREALLSRHRFASLVTRHRTNSALLTSSLFAMMANESPSVFRNFRLIVVGGDVVPAKQVQSVRRLCPGLTIVNAYGPTENAVISTAHVVTDDDALDIPIGKPIANTTAYVFSRHGQLQPIGVPGELFVGGAGIGPGYLNNPEQTAASFVTVAATGNEKLYRTGDIVSWREDGALHFVGRRDSQIKIRGLRVEIGEIEKHLLSIESIKEAVVLCRKVGSQHDPVLEAYVTGPVELDTAAVRRALLSRIPPHMVPAWVEQIPALPLTPNGKVDRQALSARAVARASAVPAPPGARIPGDGQDALVETVIHELAGLLGRTDIRHADNFLALGGSSLTAALLASRLEAACGRRCTASGVLNSDSLGHIASMLSESKEIVADGFVGEAASDAARLASVAQKQIFVEQSKFPESTAYNLPLEIIVHGVSIDEARLRNALQWVVDRHETMRTVFALEDGHVARRVLPRLEVEIEVIDCDEVDTAHAPSPFAHEGCATRWVKPFDLTSTPPWRVALLHTPEATRILCDFHHILVDGTSIAILLGDWSDAYDAVEASSHAASFDHYVDWATRGEGARSTQHNQAFWREVFSDWAPSPDLPTDRRRMPMRDWRGGACRFSLGSDLTARVNQSAREFRITPYSLLLSAYALWLASVTGEPRPVVGTAAAGRSMPGSERIAGMFVNTVCLRLDVGLDEQSQTVVEWLTQSARHIRTCLDHQDCSFLWLAETFASNRAFDRHPLFDSMFTMQNTGMSDRRYFGAQVKWRPEYTRASLFDLNLQIEAGDTGLSAIWTYNTQLFDRGTVERFAGHWLSVVEQVVRDGTRRMSSLLADPALTLVDAESQAKPVLPPISFAL